MEGRSTPHHSTEDSGFASGQTIHSSLNLTPITTFESTPNELTSLSRKRKLSQLITPNSPNILKSYLAGNIASSTLNESAISKSFEKCNISTFTPNFYVQRPEFSEQESPRKKPKSEPTTPTKCDEETEFFRRHNNSFQKTPTKCLSMQRLGSPECNKILYGGELKTNSITKTTTLRFDNILKRHSPAKKRLFKVNEFDIRRRVINPHKKFDPVKFFVKERNIECVFERIFRCLNDEDLYSFMRVSKDWKKTVMKDGEASLRLNRFLENARRDKENSFEKRKSLELIKKNAVASSRENNSPYSMMNSDLREGQRHNKCPKCTRISVVERNIGQCVHETCGYIYCLNCSSCSTTGPENFQDKCMQSKLVIPTEYHRPRITLSPKREPLSFFMNTSSLKRDSNGCSDASDMDISPMMKNPERRRSSVLGEYNRDSSETKLFTPRRIPLVRVVSIEHPRREIMEPSSPPKIKNVACSMKSKKNLKRLIRN